MWAAIDAVRGSVASHAGIDFRPLPSDDPKIRRPDIAKAKRILGWEPKVPLEQGIAYTVDYFRTRIAPDQLVNR